jgi:hypothetical protein
MATNALRAAALGAGIAVLTFAISFVRALFTRAALSIEEAELSSTVAGLTDGTIGALALLALTHSPAWPPARNRFYPWLAAAAIVVASGFLFHAISLAVCAFVVGWLLADGMRELLPAESKLGSRAAIVCTAISFVGGAPLLALAVDRLGFAGESGGMLGGTALTTLLALVVTAPVLRGMLRARASALRTLELPSDWTWGWLNDRNSGTRALGYLYRDPSAGFSFHVLSDLAAAPSPAGLRAAGYRGPGTLRLGRFETLHLDDCAPDATQSAKRRFEQGGMFGTVVMALTPHEQQGLGLPAAPPWVSAYLSPPSQRHSQR